MISHKQFDDFSSGERIFFSHSQFHSVIFLSLIHSHLLIISIEMPQLGQLAVLMAVITPCFPSMSLIHLTAFFPLCCSPSILIKPELNDQRWLGAGAHPSQHVAQRRDLRWLLFICSRLQADRSMLSLCSQCICALKLKRTFMDVMEVPFIDV